MGRTVAVLLLLAPRYDEQGKDKSGDMAQTFFLIILSFCMHQGQEWMHTLRHSNILLCTYMYDFSQKSSLLLS